MKGKLLFVLLLPFLAYVGVKVYIHVQVGQTVDQVVAQLSPFVDIQYESVVSSYDGKIGISGIVIRPHTIADSLSIDEISIKGPDMMYLLDLENRIREQDLPAELSIRVDGLAFAARGPLMEVMEESIYASDPAARTAAFENCVTRTNSLPTQQHLLQYEEISIDMEGGYFFDEFAAEFVLHGRLAQDDAWDMSGEFALPMEQLSLVGLQKTFADPEVARASFVIVNDGYFERLYAYCDQEDRIDRAMVVELLAEKYLEMFDEWSMQPTEAMVADYRQFVDRGSEIVVSIDPIEPRRLSYLSLYAPEDVPKLLNITTRVN